MGHERIGFLPKTRDWKRITDQLSLFDGDYDLVKRISDDTLKAVQSSYSKLQYDESLIKAIRFLSALSVSARKENQADFLRSIGFDIPRELSTFTILNNANRLISTTDGSLETNKIAKDAIIQAVVEYGKKKTNDDQMSLFGSTERCVWSEIGTGAAFCEIARGFVAAFTERQLKYYLERTAADSINDYSRLNSFLNGLEAHTTEISNHAFETSKLVQSFSAGWFNAHAKDELPSESAVQEYLRVSLNKMREEFRREAEET